MAEANLGIKPRGDIVDGAFRVERRTFLKASAGVGVACALPGLISAAETPTTRPIPSSGEPLPVIGMGSYRTFHVGPIPAERARRVEILRTFFAMGGAIIDSSPMYGLSEEVIGHCLAQLETKSGLFSATKVWTPGRGLGVSQMESSAYLWRLPRFDLMQIHNLVDWQTHVETLKRWKAKSKVRYIGITTSHGRRHHELEQALKHEPFDFVQLTYNLLDREGENRLLPLAAERGIAVIANRPFQGGQLFDVVENRPLPVWADEVPCENWAQFFLKFVVSHPAVTCAIPATSRNAHMQENMGAGFGGLPDWRTREKMAAHLQTLD